LRLCSFGCHLLIMGCSSQCFDYRVEGCPSRASYHRPQVEFWRCPLHQLSLPSWGLMRRLSLATTGLCLAFLSLWYHGFTEGGLVQCGLFVFFKRRDWRANRDGCVLNSSVCGCSNPVAAVPRHPGGSFGSLNPNPKRAYDDDDIRKGKLAAETGESPHLAAHG